MYVPDEKKNKIEGVKDVLYSKSADGIFVKKRHSLPSQNSPEKTPSSWSVEEEGPESKVTVPYAKILIGAFIFFLLAAGFAFYKFFGGSNMVSGNNIDILVSGPTSIAGGEVLPLDIEVKNNNVTDLQTVELRVEYPDGTKKPDDLSADMKRSSEVLGDIKVGQSEKRLVKSVLFGQENTEQTVKITVEYRLAGSNAIFSKEKDYTVLLSSSPVNISVSGADEVTANQQTDFALNITSNSLSTLKGLILKVDYPFGFNLISSNPQSTSADGSVFYLGDLAPGAQRLIRITGMLQGQDGEQRVLKFTVGTPSASNKNSMGTAFALLSQTVSIKKPFVNLSMLLNQEEDSEVAIDAGGKVNGHIVWKNNLTEKIYNMSIKVKFTGSALDKTTVRADDGFYNSFDNSLVFDRNNIPDLATVGIDSEGDMDFDFSSFYPSSQSSVSFSNASIILDISVLGTRVGGGGNTEEVLYSGKKTVRISSNLKLLARSFRTVGPFENSGPFPPKADNKTTYTITWTATNSFNNVNNARVSAILPPNVSWEGFTSPGTEHITYDQGSGEVVWDIGSIRSGSGTTYQPRDVSFQVSITPSVTQVGHEVNLLNESTISGTDVFSGARIGEVKAPVTTSIIFDPAYTENIGKVVQ
ncbi:MAG: hypothetical protein WCX27_00220 [Candidatus Paceibacterota bacterium]